jgi:hypothetical protein
VKAGSPRYWALVRKQHPVEFARMSELEQRFGAKLIQLHGERIQLADLPADTPVTDALAPACDMLCNLAEQELSACSRTH